MMSNNCQEYDFSMVSLPLRCNKPFHFCSDTRNVPSLISTFKVRLALYDTICPVDSFQF